MEIQYPKVKKALFFANPDSSELINDHIALQNHISRFVGRSFQYKEDGSAGFFVNKTPSEVMWHQDYKRDAKRGVIIPADEATAKLCEMNFDPKLVEKLSK